MLIMKEKQEEEDTKVKSCKDRLNPDRRENIPRKNDAAIS